MRTVIIDMTDAAYQRLQNGERVKGSLAMQSATGADFNAYAPKKPRQKPARVLRQPHGRVEIFADRVRMRLSIDREEGIHPADAIDQESYEASRFVEENGWTTSYRPFGYEE